MLNVIVSVFIFFNVGFLFFLVNRKLHVVDLLWGLAQGVIVIATFCQDYENLTTPLRCFALIILFWSIRLFVYLLIRNWGKPDDRRYKELSSKWRGGLALNAYFRIFLVQCILALLISFPVIMLKGAGPNEGSSFLFWFCLFVSFFGLVYESIADNQLYAHKNNFPEKRLYGKGLYKYSRHPNYFGEVVFWWGIGAASVSLGSPWWVLFSPLILNTLIYTFSGVPFHKRSSDDSGFNDWVQNTNAIIPNFFKN